MEASEALIVACQQDAWILVDGCSTPSGWCVYESEVYDPRIPTGWLGERFQPAIGVHYEFACGLIEDGGLVAVSDSVGYDTPFPTPEPTVALGLLVGLLFLRWLSKSRLRSPLTPKETSS